MTFDDLHLSADVVAVAVVAAARNTGEDPAAVVDREADLRLRHYAFHALEHCFPKIDHARIADALGCPGKPSYFRRSSLWYVLGIGPHRKVGAEWWSADVLADVISTVEAARISLMVDEAVPNAPSREQIDAFAASHGLHVRKAKAAAVDPEEMPDNPDLRPVGSSWDDQAAAAPVSAPRASGRDAYPVGKRHLFDELAAAVRNTKKLAEEE